MKSLKTQSILLFISILFFASCTKSVEKTEIDKSLNPTDLLQSISSNTSGLTPEEIFQKLKENVSAAFTISSQSTMLSDYTYGSFQGEYKYGQVSSVGNVRIQDLNFPISYPLGYHYVDNTNLNSFFGGNISLEFPFQYNGGSHSLSADFVMPQKIHVVADGNFGTNLPNISVGTNISWVKDNVLSDDYVMLSFTYDPKSFMNGFGEGNRKFKTIIVSDSAGGYTFNSQDLEDFPNNAYLNLNVYRGNLKFITHQETGKEFFMSSYSLQMLGGKCVK